jgi:hypothetical protein
VWCTLRAAVMLAVAGRSATPALPPSPRCTRVLVSCTRQRSARICCQAFCQAELRVVLPCRKLAPQHVRQQCCALPAVLRWLRAARKLRLVRVQSCWAVYCQPLL